MLNIVLADGALLRQVEAALTVAGLWWKQADVEALLGSDAQVSELGFSLCPIHHGGFEGLGHHRGSCGNSQPRVVWPRRRWIAYADPKTSQDPGLLGA